LNFATITLCVASQRVFIVAVVYFVINSVRKLLDTASYVHPHVLPAPNYLNIKVDSSSFVCGNVRKSDIVCMAALKIEAENLPMRVIIIGVTSSASTQTQHKMAQVSGYSD
jgi:hypothetical protein